MPATQDFLSGIIPHIREREDYLKTATPSISSFHFRTGHTALLNYPAEIAPKSPANSFGYPQPGAQSPTPAHATAKHYFVDDSTWETILDHGEFDDVVVGSGFCALAYVDMALKRDPWRKILILERGGFWLPEHFQNLPLPFKLVLGGPSETFPFQITAKTAQSVTKFMHGSCPFFGGRSTFWSAWSPRPSLDLMREFPASMMRTASDEAFWRDCEDLLHVTKANKIRDPVFGQNLQNLIQARLEQAIQDSIIPTADFVEHAALSVGRKTSIPNTVAFEKFSTPGPLLKIYEQQRHLAKKKMGHPLVIATETIVKSFEIDPEDPQQRPNVLHTSRGSLCFPESKTNIILAAGMFPVTTILMNSIGDKLQGRAGSRVGGHFLSHITARFPMGPEARFQDHLEIGASYLAGKDPTNGLQYHIQITAIHSPRPEQDAEDAGRLCPDYAAAATEEQLKGSENHIVLVCAVLGELDEQYKESWVKHHPANPDVTTNIRLQALLGPKAEHLWNVMDKATYDAIKAMAGGQHRYIEYWHDGVIQKESHGPTNDIIMEVSCPGWKADRPQNDMIRVPGIVHEACSLYMSDDLKSDPYASVDSNYRPRGCDGVYVTGAAIFPTSGSWNPTLTMCGYAQDLARKLVPVRSGYDDREGRGSIRLKGVGSDADYSWLSEKGLFLTDKSESGMILAIS